MCWINFLDDLAKQDSGGEEEDKTQFMKELDYKYISMQFEARVVDKLR